MHIDYKFWYIKRDDDGFITEAAIRFYEGEYVNELDADLGRVVRKYKRNKRLRKEELPFLEGGFSKELNGNDVKIYTNQDFGRISTDKQLCQFLNHQSSKDPQRGLINK